MSDRFSTIATIDGSVPVIELHGQLDGGADDELLAAWDRASDGADRVVLDFGATEYINSSGLALIVQVLARARADGCAVHATGLSDHYRGIFDITRLSDFVTLHRDRASAVA